MNPTTKPSDLRVYLGGSWGGSEPSWVRAASRSAHLPANRSGSLGFRTTLTVRQPR